MFRLWFLSCLFSAVIATWTGDSSCTPGLFCLNVTLQGDHVHCQVTNLYSSDTGYIGIGFGNFMINSPLVVLWPSSNGSTIISQRFTTVYQEPQPDVNPPFLASPATSLTSDNQSTTSNTTTMAFTIPANKNYLPDMQAVHMVWSFGRRHPDPQDDPDAILFVHYHAGRATLNLTRELDGEYLNLPPETDADPKINKNIVIFHGLLLFLGFLVVLPTGSLIARYGRSFTVGWFPVHKICNMYVAGPVIVVGWLLGPISVTQRKSQHFRDTHQIFGFVVIFAYLAQVGLGLYNHHRRTKGLVTVPHPRLNIVHVVLGLSIITFAFFQVHTGLHKLDILLQTESQWTHILFNAWVIIIPCLYLVGLALLPRQFKQEKKDMSEKRQIPSHYSPSRDPAQDPLLPNVENEADAESR